MRNMVGCLLFKKSTSSSLAAGAGEVVKNWDDLVYMQQMTPEACTGGNTIGKQLIDNRDGKRYWVAKLKDNNCWMTQNLDLDLGAITLTPDDTDINQDWTPSLMSEIWSDQSASTVKYYNPGERYCPDGKCADTPSAATIVSKNSGHDAQGNYYSWGAATARSGLNLYNVNDNASYSICPKGWQLPTSNSTTANKSFGKLLNGLNTATIMAAPYYYIYGGLVVNGSLSSAGSNGFYWSSTAYNASNAYYLRFNSGGVYPSDLNTRYYGYSVRCVAR